MKQLLLILIVIIFPITVMAELGPRAKIIFVHHSMGALMLGNRTLKPRGFAKAEDLQMCVKIEELNRKNGTNVELYHHDRDIWDSLRDCDNNLVEPSWGNIVMGKDGNTPSHWQRLFINNEWPEVRKKFLEYDVIVIKNSYQTVQDDHSPGYEEDPKGAYTIVDKMAEWKQNLRDLAMYFRQNYPDKILVHLGLAPRRGLASEGIGIHYPKKEVADASRVFAQWMADEWVCLAPNIRFFYWFDYLADKNNTMDKRWRYSGSHYTPARGKEIGLILSEYLYEVATLNTTNGCK